MPPPGLSQEPIRFGDYVVDLHAGELRKHGIRIRLQVQPFQILQILLERPGEAVTREELQKRIWPADTFVDFDHGLNNAVKKLREALSDDAEQPRFIETLPKRGYRFIGTLDKGVAGPPVAQDSIAVLPFLNMSADQENEFFADGITEEIINALAQIKELRVAARSSSFTFKGKQIDPRTVGEQLNARTVLEGSVRKAGSRLRITAQLINAEDGYHFWSECYDREMKDVFQVQEDIARAIAGKLQISLAGIKDGSLVKAGTENLDAYQQCLKGRALLYQRGGGLPRALECFQRAVTLDPDYAEAWAHVADAYVMLAFYGFTTPDLILPKAKEAAQRAVTLGPGLGLARSALAAAILMNDLDWSRVESEYAFALELDPRNVHARSRYALWCLVANGRFDESISQASQALEMDPLSGYAASILAFAYYVAGRFAEGLQTAKHAMQLEPDSFLARVSLAFVLYAQRNCEEAVGVIQAGLPSSGRHPMFMASLAATLAAWGKAEAAKSVQDELLARSAREYVSPFLLSVCASVNGQPDEAIQFVRRAYEIRDPQLLVFGEHWIGTERLREDPRFPQFLAGIRVR